MSTETKSNNSQEIIATKTMDKNESIVTVVNIVGEAIKEMETPITTDSALMTEPAISSDDLTVLQETAGIKGSVERRSIETITADIIRCKMNIVESFLDIGRFLIEAKKQLDHGAWLPWLRDNIEFSEVTAQRYMRMAEEYSKASSTTYLELGVSKAFILLAISSDERESFISETHVVNGDKKSVSDMNTKELETVVREHTRKKPIRTGSTQSGEFTFTPRTKKPNQTNSNNPLSSNDAIGTFDDQLESVQSHIDSILSYILALQEEYDTYISLSNKLRTLFEKYLQFLPMVELHDSSEGNDVAS